MKIGPIDNDVVNSAKLGYYVSGTVENKDGNSNN